MEFFRCAVLGIGASGDELVFEIPPQEGATRQEAMMKMIEVVEGMAQKIMASVEGRAVGG
jgi:hypothetical protein